MIKLQNHVSRIYCDICNKECVLNASDISLYEYSSFVKVDGESYNFCGFCGEQIQNYIKKLKTPDYLI